MALAYRRAQDAIDPVGAVMEIDAVDHLLSRVRWS
jgi:hypothetical protein